MALTLADLLTKPDHYLHSFDGDAAIFVPMSRAAYHRSIFLDGRISPHGNGSMRLPLASFRAQVPSKAQTGWIFHVAHCGSTLLARALDDQASNLILREPLALRQLALAPDPQKLTLVSAMLGKRYRPDLPTVVKANVPVNFMLPQLAARDPLAPAIYLYLGLRDYLLAILRSTDHRAWLDRVTRQLGRYLGDLSSLSDAERAAALWLAQIRAFASVMATMPNGRSLDAERLFADPATVLTAAATHLHVPLDEAKAHAITQGPLFASYSKNPALSFDNAARLARRDELIPGLGQEIAVAQTWIERQGPDAALAWERLIQSSLVP